MKNETYYKSCTYIIILIRNILIKHDYEKKINVSVNFLRKIEKSIRNKILYYTSNLKKNWILNSLHSYKEYILLLLQIFLCSVSIWLTTITFT